jgi:hypothetical protein
MVTEGIARGTRQCASFPLPGSRLLVDVLTTRSASLISVA